MRPFLSIIIPISRWEETVHCLESLARQTTDNFEVILVGDPGEPCPLDLNFPFPQTYIEADAKHPARKRNLAARQSQGAYLTFIDDDTVIPPHWTLALANILKEYPEALVGGPNRDNRPDFRFLFPQAIQEHPLLEGLKSHSPLKEYLLEVNRHNLPLCNLTVKREIFDQIGGFNDKVSYFLDDVEFNYIAQKLGYSLYLCSGLEIQHNIRPALFPYLSYKYFSRKEIGKVCLQFYELYQDSCQIKLILLSYIILPILLMVGYRYTFLILLLFFTYFPLLYLSSWRYVTQPIIFILLPFGVFFTQLFSYVGFTLGLLQGIIDYFVNKEYIQIKKQRYHVFKK